MFVSGLDIGYGYTKAVSGEKNTIFPSVIGDAPEIAYHSDLVSSRGHCTKYTVDSKSWFVGDDALLQSKQQVSPFARERVDSETLDVLLCAALNALGVGSGEQVVLVTGLPVSWYTDRPRLAKRLLGHKLFQVDGEWRHFHVHDVAVVPQPFGAFFRSILGPAGHIVNSLLARGRVAVVDVGMYTTDYALSDGLTYVEKGSGSIPLAMSSVYDLMAREIKQQWGLEMSPHQVDRACRSGEIRIRGQSHAVQQLLESALDQVWDSLQGKAFELWGDGLDLDAVVVAGGGAAYFGSRLEAMYPQVTRANGNGDPGLANCEGFYRYAVRKFGSYGKLP